MEPKKQYVIKAAYIDNWYVLQYIDGRLEAYNIVSYWDLDGYLSALKNNGYTQAYFVREYNCEMLKAKEEYEWAVAKYEEALKNPLEITDDEIERYRKITRAEI